MSYGQRRRTDPGDKAFERKVDLLLWPEFKTPTAVAASSGSADKGASGSAEAEAAKFIYRKDESDALRPLWGVRKLTTDELQKEKDQLTRRMKQPGRNEPTSFQLRTSDQYVQRCAHRSNG